MIKTKEKRGIFGKVMASACSVALVASLTPAAAMTAFADPAEGLQDSLKKITVTVNQKDSKGGTAQLWSVVLNPDAISNMNTTGSERAIYWTGKQWGVAQSNDGILLNTLFNATKNNDGTKALDVLNGTPNAEVTFTSGFYKSDDNGKPVIPSKGITNIGSYTAKWADLTAAANWYPDTTGKELKTANAEIGTANSYLPAIALNDVTSFSPLAANGTDTAASPAVAQDPVKNSGYTLMLGTSSDNAMDETDARSAAAQKNFIQGVNQITITLPHQAYDNTSRIAGTEWADTMYDSVKKTFPRNNYKNIVIATSVGYHDALAASGFAGLLGAPILITDQAALTPQTKKLITSLTSGVAPTDGSTPTAANKLTVYVIGGVNAISDNVMNEIRSMPIFSDTKTYNSDVIRLGGTEAWDTSLEVFKAGQAASAPWLNTAGPIICTSKSYMDALSIAPYAYSSKRPIILTNESNILANNATKELTDYFTPNTSGAVICGGSNAVSYQVQVQLADLGQDESVMKRYAGYEWDETSNKIASALYDGTLANSDGTTPFKNAATTVGIATADDYYDALSAAAYCGTNGMPLVLVSAKQDNAYTIENFIADNSTTAVPAGGLTTGVIFGGTGIIPESFQILAEDALN